MRAAETSATMALLTSMAFLPLSQAGALLAGEWRAFFRGKGVTLSLADCLVAATAHEHGARLVTENVSHYPRLSAGLLAAADL
jgi:predicted nucleic acid-binding protein